MKRNRTAVPTRAVALVAVAAAVLPLGGPPAAAMNPGPDLIATVTGNAVETVTFASRARNTRSKTVAVRFTSIGDLLPVTIEDTVLTDPTGSFPLIQNGCTADSMLMKDEFCEAVFAFHPSGDGPLSAAFAVSFSGGGHSVALAGEGQTPAPLIRIDKTAVAFAPLALGYGTGNAVDISNPGFGNLTIRSIEMLGSDTENFYIDPANRCRGKAVAEGTTCRVGVIFVPRRPGPMSGTVRIDHDAPGEPLFVSVTAEAYILFPAIQPSPIDFGRILAGESATTTVTVVNTYYRHITIGSVSVEGADAAAFSIGNDTCSGAYVLVQKKCTVTVRFSPLAAGAHTATLRVTSDAPGGVKEAAVAGAGHVRAPAIAVSATSIDFGRAWANEQTVRRHVVLTNVGDADLVLSSTTITGASAREFRAATECPPTIAPGQSCAVTLGYTPGSAGTKTASVSIAGNTPSPTTIALHASAVRRVPVVSLSAARLSFGDVGVGDRETRRLRITNTGYRNLLVRAASITGSSRFAIARNGCGNSLARGESCNITVRFSSPTAGTRTGDLVLRHNAGAGTTAVPLKARAVR